MPAEQTSNWCSGEIAIELTHLRAQYDQQTNEQYAELLAAISDTSKSDSDPYLRSLLCSVDDELQSDIPLHEILLDYVRENPNDELPISIRKLYSSFQELIIPTPVAEGQQTGRHKPLMDEAYPDGYDRPDKWREAIEIIKQDPVEQGEAIHFRLNLIDKQLQSNIISRFAVIQVALQLFGITRPNIYSGGSSFGLIEKMMAYYNKDGTGLPGYAVGELDPTAPTGFRASPERLAAFMGLLNNPDFQLGQVLGVDLDPPTDPLTRSYAYSNCFRGPEYQNTAYRRAVASLVFKQPPAMRIVRGDYAHPHHIDHIRGIAPDWFDLPSRWAGFISTQYQLMPSERRQANKNARQLVGTDGHVAHMEFAERDTIGRLRYQAAWSDWKYNLYVTPPGSDKPLHVFRMRNGRALDIVPGDDLADLSFASMVS